MIDHLQESKTEEGYLLEQSCSLSLHMLFEKRRDAQKCYWSPIRLYKSELVLWALQT